jgi:hypothetical protein
MQHPQALVPHLMHVYNIKEIDDNVRNIQAAAAAYVSIRQHTSAYVSIRQHERNTQAAAARPAFALVCSGVCWRMLAYAGVCWRMLTYADVC